MDYRDGKWAGQILALQNEDGGWGCFHTLSQPTRDRPMTTEQALRRLQVLGFTAADEPIGLALNYMRGVLRREHQPPDGRERVVNWDFFEALMMAAWLRRFVPDDPLALPVAELWAEIISAAFAGGSFDEAAYKAANRARIPVLHRGERLISITSFYMVSLLRGTLSPAVESAYLDYVIGLDEGICYVYGHRAADLPPVFASRRTSQYLAALELFPGYTQSPEKLAFAVDWLEANRDRDGQWDLGAAAKDGVHLPLSDSWRKPEDRRRDCTHRIQSLLRHLQYS